MDRADRLGTALFYTKSWVHAAIETVKMMTAPTRAMERPGPCERTSEEEHALFDRVAQRNLGISGAEFVRRLKAGEYGPDPDDHPRVMRVAMFLPSDER